MIVTVPKSVLERRSLIVPTVLAVVAVGCGSPTSESVQAAATGPDAVATPVLDWRPCSEAGLAAFECAAMEVPLDYSDPQGGVIILALLKEPAHDPSRRIGSVVVPAGGPGLSALDAAATLPSASGEVAERFDTVTFDQRGVGRSGQVKCFENDDERQRFWADVPWPPAAGQEPAARQAADELAGRCDARAHEMLPHLSTVNVAYDVEMIRRAVDDEKLTFSGASYATYIGETYAAVFGDRLRAMHLGSVIDPRGYSGDTVDTLHTRALGTESVLGTFAQRCDSDESGDCAISGGASATASSVLDRLGNGPIIVGSGGESQLVRLSDFALVVSTLLGDPVAGWPALAELFAQLDAGEAGDPLTVREILGATTPTPDFFEAHIASACADHRLPDDPTRWDVLEADSVRADASHFGALWLSLTRPCASWPESAARYDGPWRTNSETPLLLINNREDPVTPLSFARSAREALDNARLVIVDGSGHDTTNDCTTAIVDRYLVDRELPPAETVCS